MAQVRSLARRTAAVVTLLGLIVFGGLGWSYLLNLKEVRQHAAGVLGQSFALRVVERFHETVGPVFMLATLAQRSPGGVSNFDVAAAELIYEFPLIRALELAPGGVVTTVYPLSGNEAIIGHDLLKDRERNKEAHTALVKRQMTLAGPFELKQGGLGAVARYPIFVRDVKGKSSFWGFSIAVINVPELLAIAGEMELERAGYDYSLCRVPPGESQCKDFARQGKAVTDDSVVVRIGLPNNNWLLSLVPSTGWISPFERMLVLGLVLVVALAIGAAQYLLLVRASGAPDRTD